MIPSLSLIRHGAFGFNKQCHVILGLKSGEMSILPKSWESGLGGRDESPFSPQCKLLPRHGFKDAATLCYSHLKEAAKLSLTVSNTGAVPDISLFHNPLDNVKNFHDNEMELIVNDMTFDTVAPFTKTLNLSLSLSYILYIHLYIPLWFSKLNIFAFSRHRDYVVEYTWKHI